jgi:hypothetical protein
MWIRSQDKETLTKVKHLSIRYLSGSYSIFTDNHLAPNEICNLGTYSTKEKALKVLDKIVEEINYGDLQNVFQMPANEEVV